MNNDSTAPGAGRPGPAPGAAVFFNRRHLVIFGVILAAAAIPRIAHVIAVHDSIMLSPRGFLDDAYYHQLALRVADGDLALGGQPFFLSPLYIYFLALIHTLFPAGLLAPFLVQAAVSTACVALVHRAAARAFSPAAGLAAAALIAFDGLDAMYSATLLPASLDPALAALLCLACIEALQSPGKTWWLAAGAAASALAVNRPNALVLLPAAALLPVVFRAPRPAVKAGFTLAAGLLVLMPFAVRNLAVSGELVLISSHGGLNFYIGNGRDATGFYRSPEGVTADVRGQEDEARRYLESVLHREVEPGEVSGLFYRQTFKEIKDDPGRWVRLLGFKALCMLSGREAGLNYSLGYMREAISPVLWLMPVGMTLLLPLGIMGAVAGRNQKAALATAALAALYAGTLVLFFIADRYRLPVHPWLAVLAGGGVVRMAQAVARRERKTIAVLGAVLVVFGGLALYDPGVPSGAGQMRLMHALRLLEDGRIDEARKVADGMPPGAMNPFFWRLKLARAYRAAGSLSDAEVQYDILIGMAPNLGDLRCERAEIYLETGREDKARDELSAGLQYDPDDPGCRALVHKLDQK